MANAWEKEVKEILKGCPKAVAENIRRSNALFNEKNSIGAWMDIPGTNAYALMLLHRSTHKRLLDPCDD